LIKTINLEQNIVFDKISWYNTWLFFFNSIDWNTEVYSFDWSLKTPIALKQIQIDISYKNSTSESLQKHLIYYTKTNIVDF
jgi:hypothetical protein